MATIYIDNEPYTVEPNGRNLLEVCLSLGLDLPYFCWHPALKSVGACRQCAVILFRDENDTRGRLTMACMTAARDGMRLSLTDPRAVAFRASIIEWLMVNHPHDCPVCDEGGECHLQDMTVMTGHVRRDYRFDKRTHRNQNLGPLVNHEMNRCIACYRCVRYYRDYAGGRDLQALGWHDHVYFGRMEDGTLESPFSGNLVEVCPTGVFTDKTLGRHYTRKWDLQTAPSLCVHCGVGCNTMPGERYGLLRRVQNRFHHEINGYFLCDRGRYGYEFVNDAARPRVAADPDTVRGWLSEGRVAGAGSPRASLEANAALRALVGAENFYAGVAPAEHALVALMRALLEVHPTPPPSLREVEEADAVLLLGEDPTHTTPRLALALRQAALRPPMAAAGATLKIPPFDDAALREAVQDATAPFFIATPQATALDGVAMQALRLAPDDVARLGYAIAAGEGEIAAALRNAQRPLVVAGFGSGSPAVAQAAAAAARALGARLCFTLPACNSLGLALFDAPGVADMPRDVKTLILLETDLFRLLPDAEARLRKVKHVVVLDCLATPTVAAAHAVLPTATFAEADGTLVNYEGRAQRHFRVFPATGDVREAWQWLDALRGVTRTFDEVTAALAALPAFAGVEGAAPRAEFRLLGQPVPRQPHRTSGRTAVTANVDVHEPTTPPDPDSPLAFSMEGYQGHPPAPLTPRFWAPGWNSQQALNKFQQEVGGPLVGRPTGVHLLPVNTGAVPAGTPPPPFQPRADAVLFLPAHHIFGSEPLSARAPGIAALTPAPALAVGAALYARLGGGPVEVRVGDAVLTLPLREDPALPVGTAVLPVGLCAEALPAWGTLTGGPRDA